MIKVEIQRQGCEPHFPSWDIMIDFMIKALNDEEADYNPLEAL
jgi:hypothetical protein